MKQQHDNPHKNAFELVIMLGPEGQMEEDASRRKLGGAPDMKQEATQGEGTSTPDDLPALMAPQATQAPGARRKKPGSGEDEDLLLKMLSGGGGAPQQ